MKKILFSCLMLTAMLTSCQNDDTDFSAYTDGGGISTIYITYDESSVTVSGDNKGVVTTNGADVTVNSQYSDSLLLVLSGSTSDGSLIVYRSYKYGIQLDGVSIHNADGAAINNQCKKSLYITCTDGTTNTLTDGTTYATQDYDQKGTLFSEGQIIFKGSGTLSITGNYKHAIASDDYIVVESDIILNATSTAGHGIKVNDGIWINGGTLDISTTADGGRGIKCDSVTVISGGDITINTSGDCLIETDEETAVVDTTSAACIKSEYAFTMTGGTLTLTSTGDGGKGINCDAEITFSGGTLTAVTTGSNEVAKPKAVKGEGITVSGGSFYAKVSKSWACDNGTDSDTPADHLTIEGTPTTQTVEKKLVNIVY